MTGRKTVATRVPKKSWPQAKVDAFNAHLEAERALVDIVCMLSDDEWGEAIRLAVLGMQQESAAGASPEYQGHMQHCAVWLANVRAARKRHIEARTGLEGDDEGEPTWTE